MTKLKVNKTLTTVAVIFLDKNLIEKYKKEIDNEKYLVQGLLCLGAFVLITMALTSGKSDKEGGSML